MTLLATFWLSGHILSAQGIDSLENLLKTNPTDKQRLEILNVLSRNLIYVNTNQALDYANEALMLARNNNDQLSLAHTYRNLGSIYSYLGSFHTSLDYINRAEVIFREAGDSTGIANVYMSLGHTFRRLGKPEMELNYHQKSFKIFEELKDRPRLGVAALNLGESYYNTGSYWQSQKIIDQAIELNIESKNLSVLTACYKVKGLLRMQQEDYVSAEFYFMSALEISDNLGKYSQKLATMEALIALSDLYAKTKKPDKQVFYLKRAADFGRKYNLSASMRTIYTQLIFYYTNANQPGEVKKYLAEYQMVSDSIAALEMKDRANLAEDLLRLQSLERNHMELERETMLQQERNRFWVLLLVLVTTIVGILVWVVIRMGKINKEIEQTNQALMEKNDIIEEQKRHLEELNETKSKFFSIVAHDLRSPMVTLQSYTALLIDHMDVVTMDELQSMGTKLQVSVDSTIKMMDNLLTWARRQMNEIETKPETFDVASMLENIYSVYHEIAAQKSIVCSPALEPGLTVYGDKEQITFVVRNLVNNAIKFTKQYGSVSLTTSSISNNEMQIEIRDTGVGMSDDMVQAILNGQNVKTKTGTMGEKGTGLGLALSLDFIKSNNGKIEIESSDTTGTWVRLTFPKVG
jgi:signal transduction histidine kinase